MQNFWEQLPKPIFALAPLEDVSDAAFRRIIAQKGKPSVFYTEFTSADGLALADERGQQKLRRKLIFSEIERPIVAQLFTANPEHMEQAARLCVELGFNGVDINMGCPVNEVVHTGCGAAMIQNPPLAREIIRAAKRGAGKLPVSVKTRLGYSTDELETWLPELLAEEPVAIAIHARTRKEMSDVPARWERIARAVEIRDSQQGPSSLKTLILGNGDLRDIADAREKVAATGADGAMLGRAIFGNPWLFADRAEPPSPRERLEALAEHITLFNDLLGDVSNFATMKKHFKAYVSGWDDAKEMRMKLMETENAPEAISAIERLLREHNLP